MVALEPILKSKYPAKAHARRVAEYLKEQAHVGDAIIYLEAQKTKLIEDNDEPVPFRYLKFLFTCQLFFNPCVDTNQFFTRQRRPFFYLSGCLLPDACLTYSIPSDTLTLFIPPIDPDSVIWSGLPLSPEEALKLYEVDSVLPSTELNASLAHSASNLKSSPTIFAIPEQVSPHTTFLSFENTNFDILKKAIEDTRVVKDDYEVAMLKHANAISTLAHTAVLKAVKTAKNERELEAVFFSTCIKNGAREQAYHPIVAGGTNAATLHYQKNDGALQQENTLNLLLDAGGEYRCYCADITRTFPIGGEFTPESRAIYDIVFDMQLQCLYMLKTGVRWENVHEHAHKVAIKGLLKLGVLQGDEKEIFDKRVSVAFFPHGLGHYLGMDTHDTGGNPNYEDKDTMFRYLRVRGQLPAGAVITVEPGVSSDWPWMEIPEASRVLICLQVYFCRFIIEPFLKDPELSKYIDESVLDKYWSAGGVRIEGDLPYSIIFQLAGV
jgi:Xaa-Pro dipeptidase